MTEESKEVIAYSVNDNNLDFNLIFDLEKPLKEVNFILPKNTIYSNEKKIIKTGRLYGGVLLLDNEEEEMVRNIPINDNAFSYGFYSPTAEKEHGFLFKRDKNGNLIKITALSPESSFNSKYNDDAIPLGKVYGPAIFSYDRLNKSISSVALYRKNGIIWSNI